MPLIPTLSPGAVQNVQRPAMQQGPGIRVNLSGVQQAAGGLSAAIDRQPRTPVFDQSSGALALIGAAQNGLNVMGDLALHIQEVNDVNELTKVEMEMERASKETRNAIASNPDPTKWQDITNKTISSLEGSLPSDKLSERGKAKLALMMDRYKSNLTLDAQYDAINKINQNTLQTLNLRADNAVADGNKDLLKQTRQEQVRLGLMAPEVGAEVAVQDLRAIDKKLIGDALTNANTAIIQGQPPEVARKFIEESPLPEAEKKNQLAQIDYKYEAKVQRDEFTVLMSDDPTKALNDLADPKKFDKINDADRVVLKDQAEARKTEYGAQEAQVAMESVDMLPADKIAGATLDSLGVSFKQATPFQKFVVQKKLEIKQGKAQMNSDNTYNTRMAQAMTYSPENDPNGLNSSKFEMLLEQEFSGPMLERLKGELDKRRKGEVPQIDPGPALALMEEWTEEGALGQYKVPVTVNGKPVMKDPTKAGQVEVPGWLWGTNTKDVFPTADGGVSTKETPLPVTEIDKVKEARVAATKKQIREQLEKEIKVGKLKSNDEVSARMVELFTNAGGKVPPKMATEQPSLFPTGTPTIPPDLNKLLDTYAPKSR